MKKFLLLLIVFSFFVKPLGAQTEVEGTFFSDLTWTASESPYLIVGNVQMGGGATLTIEPGVVVKFTGAYEIMIVEGIQINGTSEDSVIIESLDADPLETTFIRFLNSNLSNSQITFTRIEGADNLILIDDECDQILNINNSLFKNGGFRNGDSNVGNEGVVLVEDCIFRNAEIVCKNRGEILISSCDVYDSVIESRSSRYNPQLIGIIVDSSNLYNSVLTTRSVDRGLLIENSNMNGCNFSAKYTILMIQNCRIMNSSFNLDYVDWSYDSNYFELVGCIVKNTSVESNTTSSDNDWYASIDMENCIVVKEASTVFGCYQFDFINSMLIGDSLSLGVLMERGEILNSSIVNNDVGLRIIDSGIYTSIEGSNLFRNFTFNVELENVSYSVSGINSYWGSANPYEIAASIYDVYDDISLGMVNFAGFLNEPNENCPISPPFGLSANNSEQGLQLNWHANPEPDIAGYRLHYGNFDGFEFENVMDMGSDTTFLVPFFLATDSLAITAYDNQFNEGTSIFINMTTGHESWYSTILTTDVLTDVAENGIANSDVVKLFPNPVNEVLFLEFSDSRESNVNFYIFDLKGVLMQKGSSVFSGQGQIDVSNLSNGSYLIEMTYQDQSYVSKFIKL